MTRTISSLHLCTFSSGLDDLPKRVQRSAPQLAKYLAEAGRFSVFEATANDTIAKTIDRLLSNGWFERVGGAFPWTEVKLTEKGRIALAEAAR